MITYTNVFLKALDVLLNLSFGSMSFPLLTLLAEGELTTNHQKWSFTFWIGQLRHTRNTFFLLVRRKMNEIAHRILALLKHRWERQFSVLLGLLSCVIQTKPFRKRKIFLWSSEMVIIITSKTTTFTAAFHGLYLLAAHSHSLQLIPLFLHEGNGLGTMSNKRN